MSTSRASSGSPSRSRPAVETARTARGAGPPADRGGPVDAAISAVLVAQRQRHLKWRALDFLESLLMISATFNFLRGFGSFRMPSM